MTFESKGLSNVNTANRSDHSTTLVTMQPSGSRLPFFCIAGILGSVLDFYPLSRHLNAEQPFYGLRSLGLRLSEVPLTTIADIAACHIQGIRSVQPDGPYRIGGYSFGGKVVFEIARQLTNEGYGVELLSIIDTVAPKTEPEKFCEVFEDADYLVRFSYIYSYSMGHPLKINPDTLRSLDFDQQIDYVVQKLRSIGAQLTGLGVRKLFKIYRANLIADLTYSPEGGCPVPITFFRTGDYDLSENKSKAKGYLISSVWGWDRFSTASVKLNLLPGQHFTLLKEPYVRTLAGCLDEYLAQCLG